MYNAATVVAISLFAAALAEMIPDNDQLGITAVILKQLGDTLATIAASRAVSRTYVPSCDQQSS